MYQPTMPVPEALSGLKAAAKADPELKAQLLATREAKYPLTTFCKIATEKGFPMAPMDVIDYGEQEVAAMARSINGGGENHPSLNGADDTYELFMIELEELV